MRHLPWGQETAPVPVWAVEDDAVASLKSVLLEGQKTGRREGGKKFCPCSLCTCPSQAWSFVPADSDRSQCACTQPEPQFPLPCSSLAPSLSPLPACSSPSTPLQPWGKGVGFGSWSKPGRLRDWIPARSQEQVGVQLPNDIFWALTNPTPRPTASSA